VVECCAGFAGWLGCDGSRVVVLTWTLERSFFVAWGIDTCIRSDELAKK
jgi:hypothetical protein